MPDLKFDENKITNTPLGVIMKKEKKQITSELLLSRLQDSTSTIEERLLAIWLAETIKFEEEEQRIILVDILFGFLEKYKDEVGFHEEKDFLWIVVGCAIRKMFSNLQKHKMEECAKLLSTKMHISVQMEFAKCIGRNFVWSLKKEKNWLSDEYPLLEKGIANFVFENIDRDQDEDFYGALLVNCILVLLFLNSSYLNEIIQKVEKLELLYILELVSQRYVKYNYIDEDIVDKLNSHYLSMIDESIDRIKNKKD